MTSRKTLFQQLDPAAQPAPAMQGPGQTPLLDVLRDLASTIKGPSTPEAASNTSMSSVPPISPRMPLFTLYQGGARPLRDLIASIATGLYQPQPNPEDKLQREAKAKAAKAEEERSKEAYSAVESSVFVAG